jgi:hypothetical protein
METEERIATGQERLSKGLRRLQTAQQSEYALLERFEEIVSHVRSGALWRGRHSGEGPGSYTL